MKNKGRFLLIPAAILLLGGCSPTAKTNIPRGHDIVDPADANARNAFFAKVAKDVANTYEASKDGFKIKGTFGFDEVSYTDGRNYVKVTDAEMDFTIAVTDFGKGANAAKAMVEISDLGFKFELNSAEKNKKQSLKVSGVDAAAYYSGGNIYLDLSDKDLKDAVHDIIDIGYEDTTNGQEYASKAKKEADEYLTKLVLPSNSSVKSIEDDIFPSENFKITDEEIAYAASTLNSAFDRVLKDDTLKNLVTLSHDKNSQSAAIRIALTSAPIAVDSVNISGSLAALLSFDKEGVMDNIGMAGNVRIANKNDSSNVFELKKANFAVSFEYGKDAVKLPSFSGYKEIH
ncbi:MAG: hypothetical protein K6E21_02685 [Bacilli bacterium]|nr:hypothetical protein [Bacilli bacterium]